MIDYERELNPEQLAAVQAPLAPALVLAGAGSGKTRTLTYRVAWLIGEVGLHPHDILLLTFTNKAAREMLGRVQELIGAELPPRWGGTFHSICGRLLRTHGGLIGLSPNYSILDQDEADSLLGQIIKEVDAGFSKDKDNPKPRVVGDLISFARNTQRSLEQVVDERFPWRKNLAGPMAAFAERYRQRKLEQQVADYDDLLTHWRDILRQHAEVRLAYERKFQAILVDEYQDTNALQSEIVDLMGGHHHITAVGDDAQCIYTWRGADYDNILHFPDRHPGTTIYKIVRNYRSTPEILGLANCILAGQAAGAAYEKNLVAERDNGLLPFVVPALDGRQQAQFIIARLRGLYDEGYGLSDIAILYRAHYQALDLQLEFSRKGVPFVITSGVRFFEQAHIRDFVAQLRVVNNPSDGAAWDRLFGLLPKVGPATVRKVLDQARKSVAEAEQRVVSDRNSLFANGANPKSLFVALGEETTVAKVPADARADFQQLVATLQDLERLIHPADGDEPTPTPWEVIEKAIEGWYGDYLRQVYPNWQSRFEDLQSLIGFASRYDSVAELLAQLVLQSSETAEKGVEPDQDAVRMTTVHQAKGLEYPVVFVIGCADGLFPLQRAIDEGDLDEERRLFYVAVTRARDELYLCYPLLNSGRSGPMQLLPSRFISALPEDRYERLGLRMSRW